VFDLAAGSSTINTLASFNYFTNGANPTGDLVMDSQGNLYGTTYAGGTGNYNQGTVFELVSGSSTITDLVSFYSDGHASPLGAGPYSGLYQDSQGNLFGTTNAGGGSDASPGYGTVFKLANGTHALPNSLCSAQTSIPPGPC
jgi:uncharacterized repeat protein (TIGR03803 family)